MSNYHDEVFRITEESRKKLRGLEWWSKDAFDRRMKARLEKAKAAQSKSRVSPPAVFHGYGPAGVDNG